MTCPFRHTNIDKLFGVEPMPVEQLPKVCTCGAALTYAPTVMFVSEPEPPPEMRDEAGDVVMTSEPVRVV